MRGSRTGVPQSRSSERQAACHSGDKSWQESLDQKSLLICQCRPAESSCACWARGAPELLPTSGASANEPGRRCAAEMGGQHLTFYLIKSNAKGHKWENSPCKDERQICMKAEQEQTWSSRRPGSEGLAAGLAEWS